MARIFPFRALRYDTARVPLERVLTQPYDKITPRMQERYYNLSPFNLVRVVLGNPAEEQPDVYSAAAAHLRDWQQQGILRQASRPSFYVYTQQFPFPENGQRVERRGFIALLELADYGKGVVFRHEQTLSGPKQDRLNLLCATRAQCECLFLLYDDPHREVEKLLCPQSEAECEMEDEYGVLHRLWALSDTAILEAVAAKMRDQRLVIADGHHRYETALAFRDQQRAGGMAGGHERAMVMLVNIEDPGLLILPTHRVLSGLSGFDPQRLLEGARQFFEVAAAGAGAMDAQQATTRLRQTARPEAPAILVSTAEGAHLLRARPEVVEQNLQHLSRRRRELDVVLLHELLLGRVLGVTEQAVREQRHITYLRDPAEALERLRHGAQAVFLLNAARVEQVRDVALAGEVMPQKSTDFYPKLLSGLTMYLL